MMLHGKLSIFKQQIFTFVDVAFWEIFEAIHLAKQSCMTVGGITEHNNAKMDERRLINKESY